MQGEGVKKKDKGNDASDVLADTKGIFPWLVAVVVLLQLRQEEGRRRRRICCNTCRSRLQQLLPPLLKTPQASLQEEEVRKKIISLPLPFPISWSRYSRIILLLRNTYRAVPSPSSNNSDKISFLPPSFISLSNCFFFRPVTFPSLFGASARLFFSLFLSPSFRLTTKG